MIEPGPDMPEAFVQVCRELCQRPAGIAADDPVRRVRAEHDAAAFAVLDEVQQAAMLRIEALEQPVVDRERWAGLRATPCKDQDRIGAIGMRIDLQRARAERAAFTAR